LSLNYRGYDPPKTGNVYGMERKPSRALEGRVSSRRFRPLLGEHNYKQEKKRIRGYFYKISCEFFYTFLQKIKGSQ